ncbi:MAG: hypothetical protein IKJ43_02710 [Bacilli bacterium]|nr:hypothetical protein [Bacilli bacterium]
MEYNDHVIKMMHYRGYQGDIAVDCYLRDHQNNLPNYNNISESNMTIIDAIENYIIKRINNGEDGILEANYIYNVYNGFMTNPSTYMKSTLINKEIAQKKLSSASYQAYKNKQEKIKGLLPNIYNRRMKSAASEAEKDVLANYFIKIINTDNEKLQTKMEEYVKRLIAENRPIKETNTSELTFLAHWVKKRMDPNNELVNHIRVWDYSKKLNGGFYISNSIHINQTGDYLTTIDHFISNVCHETRHALQDKESKSKKSLIGFQYAADDILRTYLTTDTYNPYKSCNNYRYSEIETDANLRGYFEAHSVLYILGFKDRASKMFQKYLEYEEVRQLEFANKLGSDKVFRTPENTLMIDLSKVVQRYPHLINTYPSLQDFYNRDGSPKNFKEVLKEAIKPSFGNESFYYYEDYLRYSFSNDEYDNIDVNKMNDETKARYYITLIKLLISETEAIKAHLKAVRDINSGKRKTDVSNRIIIGTGQYNMRRYKKLIDILYPNYDDIKRLEQQGLINTSIWGASGIKACMRDIMNIDLSRDILNDIYKKSLEEVIDGSKRRYNQITIKNNKRRLQSILNEYDEKTLSMMIPLPNGVQLSLRQYAEQIIFSKMDRHGFYQDNETHSVRDAIKEAIEKGRRLQIKSQSKPKTDTELQIDIINSMTSLTEEQKSLLISNLTDNEIDNNSIPKHMKK